MLVICKQFIIELKKKIKYKQATNNRPSKLLTQLEEQTLKVTSPRTFISVVFKFISPFVAGMEISGGLPDITEIHKSNVPSE